MIVKDPVSMLILTRKPGQALMVGGGGEVRLLTPRIDGEVRIGITAPRDVAIVRQELTGRPSRKAARNTVSE